MRILSVFRKSIKENLRDWKVLSLTLVFGPFFVLMYYFWFGSASVNYTLLIANKDIGSSNSSLGANMGQIIIEKLDHFKISKDCHLIVEAVSDVEAAKKSIENQKADALIIIPSNLSEAIKDRKSGTRAVIAEFKYFGSMTNQRYPIAASISYSIISDVATSYTGQSSITGFSEEFLEKRELRSDFDYSVPGLVVLSVIMILFTASASIIKEVDKGTIKRLRISGLKAYEFLVGISLSQIIITALSMMLTMVSARLLGFHSAGSLLDVSFIGLLSCMSVMAVSLIVSSLLSTIFDLMTIGCFPWFILAFFSGGMFPIPQVKLFEILGHTFSASDLLPTSHAVAAINKIMNFGTGIEALGYEMAMICLLTIVYFVIGIHMFRKRHFTS